MKLNSPEDSIIALRNRLPSNGEAFLLRELVDGLEESYLADQLLECEDDSLIVVAGKYGENVHRRFEISFFRSFDLSTQLQIALHFRPSMKCWFLQTASDICESTADCGRFFSSVRAARWYRRFATAIPTLCFIRWRDETEMSELFCEVVPKLLAAMKRAGFDSFAACKPDQRVLPQGLDDLS
jgi:hypothetical protein